MCHKVASNRQSRWSSKLYWFVSYCAVVPVVCLGCEAPAPNANACPTVVPGFETFACDQSRLEGLELGANDAFWISRSSEPGMTDQGSIMRQSTTGGAPIVLASGRTRPTGLALDSSFVYWLERDATTGEVQIMKLAQTGGDPTIALTGPMGLVLIRVDDNGDIYLVVGDSDLGGYGISRVQAGSTTPQVLVENWMDGFFNVILDGDDVFFSTSAGELWRVPKLGGSASLVTGGMTEPLFMTAYASNVYVTDRSGHAIWGIDESSGALTKLADGMWLAVEIAVDDKNAYWFEQTFNTPPGTPPPSAFRTVPRAGGTASTLADIIGDDLRGDTTHLYFKYGTNILRYAK